MTAQFRPLRFGVTRVQLRHGVGGSRYMLADQELQAYPERLSDRLAHWARIKPEQSFIARRAKAADGSLGDWQHLSYAQTWQAARSLAQATRPAPSASRVDGSTLGSG